MPHPVLVEIVRAKAPVRPEVLRRWQMTLQRDVLPDLERREQAEADKAATRKAEVSA